LNVTPHVTNDKGRTATWTAEPPPARRCHQPEPRWLIEKGFGWLKQTARCASQVASLEKVDWLFVFGCAAHN